MKPVEFFVIITYYDLAVDRSYFVKSEQKVIIKAFKVNKKS